MFNKITITMYKKDRIEKLQREIEVLKEYYMSFSCPSNEDVILTMIKEKEVELEIEKK